MKLAINYCVEQLVIFCFYSRRRSFISSVNLFSWKKGKIVVDFIYSLSLEEVKILNAC